MVNDPLAPYVLVSPRGEPHRVYETGELVVYGADEKRALEGLRGDRGYFMPLAQYLIEHGQ